MLYVGSTISEKSTFETISGHKLGDKACSFDEKTRGLKSYVSITSNATRTMPSGRNFEFQILGEIDV